MIYVRGVTAKDLGYIVDFIYNGEVNIHHDDLQHFLSVAEDLEVKGLIESFVGYQQNGNREKPPVRRNMEKKTGKKQMVLPHKNKVSDAKSVHNKDNSTIGGEQDSTIDNLDDIISAITDKIDGDWKCRLCHVTYSESSEMLKHVEEFHIKGESHYCDICNEPLETINMLAEHKKKNHPKEEVVSVSIENLEDEMISANIENLDYVIDTIIIVTGGTWTCKICGKEISKSRADMVNHIESNHIQGLTHPCPLCGKSSKSRKGLYGHIRYAHSVEATLVNIDEIWHQCVCLTAKHWFIELFNELSK